jgi:Coatomer epsilon subunit
MSTEPDELYTLRAQYALGHYLLALEEAKTIARRPMSLELKAEREEFVQRCQLGLGQPVVGGDTAGTWKFTRRHSTQASVHISHTSHFTVHYMIPLSHPFAHGSSSSAPCQVKVRQRSHG